VPVSHSDDLPSNLRRAVIDAAREFNSGRYFEAHEALEESLEEVPDELWNLFLGLIQISVGYHKASQKRWSGAAKMLGLGLRKTNPYPGDAAGVQLEALRQRVQRDIDNIEAGRLEAVLAVEAPPRLQPRR